MSNTRLIDYLRIPASILLFVCVSYSALVGVHTIFTTPPPCEQCVKLTEDIKGIREDAYTLGYEKGLQAQVSEDTEVFDKLLDDANAQIKELEKLIKQ